MSNLYDVFISYRRSDGLIIAEALYKYLTSKGLRVFFDKHEMIDGHYFTTQIENNLKIAPNYILVATDDVFKFREGDDWVRKEIEVAINEYESNPTERTINVICTATAPFPEKDALPESVRNIADPQRILLPYGKGFAEPFKKLLESVTAINRRNLWFAAHRWLENSKKPGGRFANLNINDSILPNASETAKEHKEMPINVYSKEEDNDGQPLLEAMAQSNNHLYLIGQGGIGKTTALMHIMNSAYANKTYSENAKIPIFVELSFAPDTYGALYEGGKSSFIRRSIYKQIREDRTIKQVTAKEVRDIDEVFTTISYDVAVNPINNILSKTSPTPEYLLLLDGLNEVSSVIIEETGLSVVQMIMSEIDLLLHECPNVRVVLTSRSDESAICNDSISRLYLSGVQEKTIKDYLESSDLSKELIDKALKDKNLCNTLQIPLFLTMFATLKNADEVSTQGEILKLFFNERRKNISVYTMQDRFAAVEKNVSDAASAVQKNRIDADMQNFILDFILPEIAWYMERKDEFHLNIRAITKIIEPILTKKDDTSVCGDFGQEIFSKYRYGASARMHIDKVADRFFNKFGDNKKEIAENIVDCCVFAMGIMQENNSKYGFVHQHIRDYFAAVKNINTVRLSAYLYEEDEKDLALECMNKTFKDEPINITVRRFMGEALGEHRNKPYLQDGVWYYNVPEEQCDRNLIKRALNVYRNKFNGECGYGIYSLITIFKEIRKDLSDEDFSNLDMKYCNFNGTVLGRPRLSANFDGALVNDYTFMPWGDKPELNHITISPDEKILATYSKNGVVNLCDLVTFSLIKKIRLKIDSKYENHAEFFKFDKKGNNILVTINYYEPGDPIDNEPIEIKKKENFLIHLDNFETENIDNLNGVDYSQKTLPLFLYQGVDMGCFTTKEPIDFNTYSNITDLKKAENGDCFGYQEYQNHNGTLSLCHFHNGLALYDVSTGVLINKYYFDFNNFDVSPFLEVFFLEKNILVVWDTKLYLFDYRLNYISHNISPNHIPHSSAFALVSDKYIFLQNTGKITIMSLDTLVFLYEIDTNEEFIYSIYFTKDGSTSFFNTTADLGFVYDLKDNHVIDFAEVFSPGGEDDLVSLKNIYSYKSRDLENDIQYIGFSKNIPEELLTVTGYRSLHQKSNNTTTNNHFYLSVLNKSDYEASVILYNSGMEPLGTIDGFDADVEAFFSNDDKKILALSCYGTIVSFIDIDYLLIKKSISFEELPKISIPYFHDYFRDIGKNLCQVTDDTIAITMGDKIDFWDLEKKTLHRQIEHIGGLYIIDVNLNKLHSQSELSEDTKQKLRQYGAIV